MLHKWRVGERDLSQLHQTIFQCSIPHMAEVDIPEANEKKEPFIIILHL